MFFVSHAIDRLGELRRVVMSWGRTGVPEPPSHAARVEQLEQRLMLSVTLFTDTFDTGAIDTENWPTVSGATVDAAGINEPSPLYSLRLNGTPSGGDTVESKAIDLSSYINPTLSYYYERRGGGESPDSGDDLIVDYWDASGWVELDRQLGSGPDMTTYVQSSINLPTGAMHPGFRFRLRNIASSGSYDDWFVDNVELAAEPDAVTPPTVTGQTPASGSVIWPGAADIDVTFSKPVVDVDFTDMELSGPAAAGATVGTPIDLGTNIWQFPVTGLVEGELTVSLATDPGTSRMPTAMILPT